MRVFMLTVALVASTALAGCASEPQEPALLPSFRALELTTVDQLTQAVPVPGTSGDLVLLERAGRVMLLAEGAREAQPVLDIRDRVDTGGERGLVSLAFHPDFEENGMLFLAYSDSHDHDPREGFTEVVRFHADPDDFQAGLEEADVVLTIDWRREYHNMGDMKFGPDGMLYLSMGDGTQRTLAQNLTVFRGVVLRIDVDGPTGYEIPPDNPFADDPEARGEIWLYGLRNPWRIGFHPDTGDLFIAVAGEDDVEAVHMYPADGSAPRNHGWPQFEGDRPFLENSLSPDEVNPPIVTYSTRDDGMCAVVGGMVYRGTQFPDLYGSFVFSDHCSAQLMVAQQVGDTWHLSHWNAIPGERINSVDADADGEILVSGMSGKLYRITSR